ncbi:tumor necrosis factor alpha-induced protein 2 [Brachyhypopomus gauderio]|uniref:tumor necrosis factor alpha-induced protein 2 n=1 Tax=Brachyhypopomus gauderio TaxID=698409 RepID=UPI0040426535
MLSNCGNMTVHSLSTKGKIMAFKIPSSLANFKTFIMSSKKNPQMKENVQVEEVLMTLKQYLQKHHFVRAGQMLITREERLFALTQDKIPSSKSLVEEEEDSEENLKKDYEDLHEKIWSTIKNSLDVQTKEEIESLNEAVLTIQQEEVQDQRWEGFEEKERPPWRPRHCKRIHDSLLKNIVEQRLKAAQPDSNCTLKSSVQRDIISKGKQLKNDLLQVATNVKICYPEQKICQWYASLYHQAFSVHLKEIADFGLSDIDCLHVLQWVNTHYPRILRHEQLTGLIEYEQLEALLPDEMLMPLEEQFLDFIKNKMLTLCQTFLSTEENAVPELKDECYSSTLAIDVIQCIHGVLESAEEVLGTRSKIMKVTDKVKEFLEIYHCYLVKVTEDHQNAEAVLKANLHCIRQFRDYIIKNADVMADCEDLLTRMKNTCLGYFTKPIHKDLKAKYSKVGTQEWLKNNEHVCTKLLEGVNGHIQKLKNLDNSCPTCTKEILSQLHKEVLVEYVKKIMKKKIKLGDENKQLQAAEALCSNGQKIHTLFTEAGSDMEDLKDILPKLAELLTLKDPHCIELQLVSLYTVYSDFSESHVSAWLHLKGNLSNSDIRNIKKTFSELRVLERTESTPKSFHMDPFYSCGDFFSKVLLK